MQKMANRFAKELGNADAALGLRIRFGGELGAAILAFGKRHEAGLSQEDVNAAMTVYAAEHAHVLRVIARGNPGELLDPVRGLRFAPIDDTTFQCNTCPADVAVKTSGPVGHGAVFDHVAGTVHMAKTSIADQRARIDKQTELRFQRSTAAAGR